MTEKQERLIRAIRGAQEAGGYMQKQLAAMACTSPGTLSYALSGQGTMSEEKWRLLCEGLALDYEAIMAEDKPKRFTFADTPGETPHHMPEAAVQENPVEEAPVAYVNAEKVRADLAREADVVAKYLAGKLREDLTSGTDMALEDVYTLMSWVKSLQREVWS